MATERIDAWRERMRRFVEFELTGLSPLYEQIGRGILRDDEVLAWLADAAGLRANPNLLFNGVHFTLQAGTADEPLALYFPSITAGAREPADVYPAFRAFWDREKQSLAVLLATRTTQTNEVARCCYLLPAFVRAAAIWDRPLAIVDVGTSAGLTLLFDRYAYDYGAGRPAGDPGSPVRLRTDVRGAMPPVAPMPEIINRVGIDLAPVLATDETETAWLRACIWPEHAERRANLDAALEVARLHPPELVAGNALDVLPVLVERFPVEAVLVVVDTNVLPYFSAAERARYGGLLPELGAARELCWIAIEWPQGLMEAGFRGSLEGCELPPPSLPLTMTTFREGVRSDEVLAVTGPHGRWLRWLAAG